jgi:hypothetical protein
MVNYATGLEKTVEASCPAGKFMPVASLKKDTREDCALRKVQAEAGKSFCNDTKRNTYIRNNEELACPQSLTNNEANCEFGILEYFNGYWHDGLKLQQPNPAMGGNALSTTTDTMTLQFLQIRPSSTDAQTLTLTSLLLATRITSQGQ